MTNYRLTKEQIQAKIKSVSYQRFSKTGILCVLELENGYTVTGESGCIDPSIFDEEIGKNVAYEKAFDKLWSLLGYEVKQKWYEETQLDWTQRVRLELTALDEKRNKVNAMLERGKPEFIQDEQWQLMQEQNEVMQQYALILAKRLELVAPGFTA